MSYIESYIFVFYRQIEQNSKTLFGKNIFYKNNGPETWTGNGRIGIAQGEAKKSCSAVEWEGKHGTEMSRMTKTWTQENMFRNCSSTMVGFRWQILRISLLKRKGESK